MHGLLNDLFRSLRRRYLPNESLAAVAREVGIYKSYLFKLEMGQLKRPSPEMMNKILTVYGCSERVCELVREVDRIMGFSEGYGPGMEFDYAIIIAMQLLPRTGIITTEPEILDVTGDEPTPLVFSMTGAVRLAYLASENEAVEKAALRFNRGIYQLVPPSKSHCRTYVDTYICDDFILVSRTGFGHTLWALERDIDQFKKDLELFRAMAYSGEDAERIFMHLVREVVSYH